MKLKKMMYAGLITVATLTLVACGGDKKGTTDSSKSSESGSSELAKEQVFNTIVDQEMSSADLALNTDVVGALVLNNVYEGAYRLDANSEPQPAGATEMAEVSEDGLTYKLKLREDAKWSNGDPVTAKDYVYGWQRVVDPATQSEYSYLHGAVKNAEAITAGDKDKSELGIKAVGDYELEITLEKPTPYFDRLLTFTTYFPQHQATVEKYGKEFATTSEKAVYNGPFILTEFDGPGTDQDWTYVKNDQYWDKDTVKLDKITAKVVKESSTALNLYEDGQADDVRLTGELAQQMADDPELVIEKQAGVYYFEMNQRDKDSIFHNEDLRKAISYALDRESLVTKILGDGSVAATGLVPADMTKDPDGGKDFAEESGKHLEFNKEKALEHWEKAKKALGKDKIEIEILSSDSDFSKKNVEFAQGSLEETLPGLKVSVAPVPLSVRIDRSNKGDFDIVLGGWSADYADPSSFLDLFVTGNSYNRGQFSNKDYDAKLTEAATTNAAKPAERFQDMIEAEKLIMGDMGVVPIYQNAEAHMRRSTIKDVAIHGAGAHYDYKWAYVAAE